MLKTFTDDEPKVSGFRLLSATEEVNVFAFWSIFEKILIKGDI